MSVYNVKIGEIIQAKLEEDSRNASWLAKQMYCSRSAVHKILNKGTIDCFRLYQLSLIFKTDFFRLYSDDLEIENCKNK
jgi:hypothetical protein